MAITMTNSHKFFMKIIPGLRLHNVNSHCIGHVL